MGFKRSLLGTHSKAPHQEFNINESKWKCTGTHGITHTCSVMNALVEKSRIF